jgi:hypothetical protein
MVKEAKQVGTLRKEGRTKPLAEEPWGPGSSVSSEIEDKKVGRATEKEGAFSLG